MAFARRRSLGEAQNFWETWSLSEFGGSNPPLRIRLYISDAHLIFRGSMKFKIILKKGEDGYYTATVPSLPGCISQGKTEEEAKRNIKEAIELHVESLAEDGIPIVKEKDTKEEEIQVSL